MNQPFLADLIELAKSAGTLPMQVLLLLGMLTLGLVIRHLHTENQKTAKAFMALIESERVTIGMERKITSETLISLVRDDIETKAKLVHAIDNNTAAIHDLKDFIKDRFSLGNGSAKSAKK
jgi:Cft2 family RNA processing exonuclease